LTEDARQESAVSAEACRSPPPSALLPRACLPACLPSSLRLPSRVSVATITIFVRAICAANPPCGGGGRGRHHSIAASNRHFYPRVPVASFPYPLTSKPPRVILSLLPRLSPPPPRFVPHPSARFPALFLTSPLRGGEALLSTSSREKRGRRRRPSTRSSRKSSPARKGLPRPARTRDRE